VNRALKINDPLGLVVDNDNAAVDGKRRRRLIVAECSAARVTRIEIDSGEMCVLRGLSLR
jgi:hypothetical protein